MTPEEIIAMAKEARVSEMGLNIDGSIHLLGLFERFAAQVAAKEREMCLKIADDCADADMHASMAANAIRARGQKEGA